MMNKKNLLIVAVVMVAIYITMLIVTAYLTENKI